LIAAPTRNLQDDLNDFLALIPVDEVIAIALDYLANDAQVQELMAYLQSDQFHNIISTVENLVEFKNVSVIQYLQYQTLKKTLRFQNIRVESRSNLHLHDTL